MIEEDVAKYFDNFRPFDSPRRSRMVEEPQMQYQQQEYQHYQSDNCCQNCKRNNPQEQRYPYQSEIQTDSRRYVPQQQRSQSYQSPYQPEQQQQQEYRQGYKYPWGKSSDSQYSYQGISDSKYGL